MKNSIKTLKKILNTEEVSEIQVRAAILLSKEVNEEAVLNAILVGLSRKNLSHEAKLKAIRALCRMRHIAKGSISLLSRLMVEEEDEDEIVAEYLWNAIRIIHWQ